MERPGGSHRDEEARRGDILRIKKERDIKCIIKLIILEQRGRGRRERAYRSRAASTFLTSIIC